jgi:hypothetical protein
MVQGGLHILAIVLWFFHFIHTIRERVCVLHELDFYGLGLGQVVGACEYNNEPSGFVKCGEFLA